MDLWGQVKKQNFPTFHMYTVLVFCEISFGRDLGTEYIGTTTFQSVPTTKKMCKLLLCGSVGVPMLTKEEYN